MQLQPGNLCNDELENSKKKPRKLNFSPFQGALGTSMLILLLGLALFEQWVSFNEGQRQSVRLLQQVNDEEQLSSQSRDIERRKMTKCPDEFKKTFYVGESKNINQPPIRAMRMRGWQRTGNHKEAHVIWTYSPIRSWYTKLLPWQRYNQMPNAAWNSKDSFVTHMMNYSATTGREIASVPETYRLDEEAGLNRFRERLLHEGGLDTPWVLKKPNINKGMGITMLGPRSKELANVFKTVEKDKGKQNYIIQQYVCNEMTIRNRRKFDFRVFWIVASLDPLIVMYHDGFIRIGNSEYTESDFSNTIVHLTTSTALAEEEKGSWAEFAEYLAEVNKNRNLKIKDPIGHVRNQVKQVLGEMTAAFKDVSFNVNFLSAENGFGFYGADFIIDWDMDVYFIEPQSGCGLDEDFRFRVDLHDALFTQMIDATEEIWERQEKGLPVNNNDLVNHGDYEIVYNDGWIYEYKEYHRSKDKGGCALAQTRKQ